MKAPMAITKRNAALALVVAVAADGAQLLLNTPLALFFGVGAEVMDMAIDAVAAVLITSLLGFNWVLLPTFVLELVPLVDDLPSWTACVAYLIWKRGKDGRFQPLHIDH